MGIFGKMLITLVMLFGVGLAIFKFGGGVFARRREDDSADANTPLPPGQRGHAHPSAPAVGGNRYDSAVTDHPQQPAYAPAPAVGGNRYDSAVTDHPQQPASSADNVYDLMNTVDSAQAPANREAPAGLWQVPASPFAYEPPAQQPQPSPYQPSPYQPPAYQPPVYEQPAPPQVAPLVGEQAAYQPFSYQQPAYEQPIYQQPVSPQPPSGGSWRPRQPQKIDSLPPEDLMAEVPPAVTVVDNGNYLRISCQKARPQMVEFAPRAANKPVTVGRNPDCTLRIPDSPETLCVSRQHLTVTYDRSGFALRDNSQGGIYDSSHRPVEAKDSPLYLPAGVSLFYLSDKVEITFQVI